MKRRNSSGLVNATAQRLSQPQGEACCTGSSQKVSTLQSVTLAHALCYMQVQHAFPAVVQLQTSITWIASPLVYQLAQAWPAAGYSQQLASALLCTGCDSCRGGAPPQRSQTQEPPGCWCRGMPSAVLPLPLLQTCGEPGSCRCQLIRRPVSGHLDPWLQRRSFWQRTAGGQQLPCTAQIHPGLLPGAAEQEQQSRVMILV